jgi:hypothetical protein
MAALMLRTKRHGATYFVSLAPKHHTGNHPTQTCGSTNGLTH